MRRSVVGSLLCLVLAAAAAVRAAEPEVMVILWFDTEEYLAESGWLDGVAEFVRRESVGARDVRRVFSVPSLSCYGQPGSSWAPQSVAALRQIGVVISIYYHPAEWVHQGFDAGPGTPPVFPEKAAIPSGTALATERHVADDTPELFGGWIIHPDGFRAPRIVEMAKLQAWTLKPAER